MVGAFLLWGLTSTFADYKLLAQENPPQTQLEVPALFVGNSCPFSQDLLGKLEADKLEESYIYEVVEISDKIGSSRYNSAYKLCRPNAQIRYTPMMYYEGECYEGEIQVANKLYQLAGLTPPEFEQDQIVSGLRTAVELVDQQSTDSEDQTETQNLGNKLNRRPELPKMSFFEILALITIPSIFILIGYLLIKKLKL